MTFDEKMANTCVMLIQFFFMYGLCKLSLYLSLIIESFNFHELRELLLIIVYSRKCDMIGFYLTGIIYLKWGLISLI